MAGGYDFKEVQDAIKKLWAEKNIYDQAKEKNKGKKPFYFLDGPPYTSGKVHIGTAWNKTLKDLVLRYKRMRGLDVWDRAGYDMHGLPTEHATEKELGISGRKAIEEYGIKKFIDACRKLCMRNLQEMNTTFTDLGVWMDFENAYQTISKEWMEGEWWLLKKAHEQARLYEGERATTWDAHSATALAKHELEYKEVEDTAIYVKFPAGKEWLVIWTTTPWTIPYNLAIMANPDVTYVRVKVNNETWILAQDLVEDFLKRKLKTEYKIIEEFPGKKLEGMEYKHIFDFPQYKELKKLYPKVHTVLLSSEYVDTSTGTGLVHCAPGHGRVGVLAGSGGSGLRPESRLAQNRQEHNIQELRETGESAAGPGDLQAIG